MDSRRCHLPCLNNLLKSAENLLPIAYTRNQKKEALEQVLTWHYVATDVPWRQQHAVMKMAKAYLEHRKYAEPTKISTDNLRKIRQEKISPAQAPMNKTPPIQETGYVGNPREEFFQEEYLKMNALGFKKVALFIVYDTLHSIECSFH
ncbi:uncharacterized protein LOC144720632 [Lampetra planeri]